MHLGVASNTSPTMALTAPAHLTRMRSLAALALVVAAGSSVAATNQPREHIPEVPGRTVDLDYRFFVRDIPHSANSVVAWVPIPPTGAYQRLIAWDVTGGYPHAVFAETEYGNRFLRFDLSDAAEHRAGEATVSVRFRVARLPVDAPAENARADRDSEVLLTRFLAPDRLVPIDGEVSVEARRVAGDAAGPVERARRLYHNIVDTVRYDKTGQGWGRGDAVYACDVRRGNCTDFHSLFIGEARALGIPARFVMGLPLPADTSGGTIPGYHCWAEFYVRGLGWLPVDASGASRHPQRREALFTSLDANRVEFTVGRDIRLPQSAAAPVNYSIYPHVEVDGVEFSRVETSFSFRDLPRERETTAPAQAGARSAVPVSVTSGSVAALAKDRQLSAHIESQLTRLAIRPRQDATGLRSEDACGQDRRARSAP